MAKLVFGMNVSLDGYVDHMGFAPGPAVPPLHRAGARADRQRVRPQPVRDHAVLGRRPSRVGRGETRLRGGVAEPAKWVVSIFEVGRPQPRWSRVTSRRR
jgi:hypothetical protein